MGPPPPSAIEQDAYVLLHGFLSDRRGITTVVSDAATALGGEWCRGEEAQGRRGGPERRQAGVTEKRREEDWGLED